MAAEARVEEQVADAAWASLYDADFIRALHRSLFAPLPIDDLKLDDGAALVPGEFRVAPVTVGRHLPRPQALDVTMSAWQASSSN